MSTSKAFFEAGLRSLDAYVRADQTTRLREIWVIQAYMLYEYFAIYSCQENLFITALKIHRRIVDAARKYQMLQDGVSWDDNKDSSSLSSTQEDNWQVFVEHETRKRVMYCLYYVDAQLSICCNVRPLLTALELKYDLPCRDDVWAASTAEAWGLLAGTHETSFNEEEDARANADPRPEHGDLYESLMQLMDPSPADRPLGLLWYSSFACLMLVIQFQMMTRELTLASTFLYKNIRCGESRHNLTIITEGNRAPIQQALHNLADLMPKLSQAATASETGWPLAFNNSSNSGVVCDALWKPVWIAWHYTYLCLTHQDALLTSGIVEYSLPSAISTAWELGKPRAREHRDVYEDRDIMRVVDNLEHIIGLLKSPPTMSPSFGVEGVDIANLAATGVGAGTSQSWEAAAKLCVEDPFTTMLGFKSCIMGWRAVRLMALALEQHHPAGPSVNEVPRPSIAATGRSIYTLSAQVVLSRIMEVIGSGSHRTGDGQMQGLDKDDDQSAANGYEARYLDWVEKTFARRGLWPSGRWLVAVFDEV